MRVIENWFFKQSLVEQRAALLRIICGLIVALYLFFGPADDFILGLQKLFSIEDVPYLGLFRHYTTLKWLTIGASLFLILGFLTPVSSLFTFIGFFINCYANFRVTPGNWGYTPHIHLFLLALMFCQSNRKWSLDAYLWPKNQRPVSELSSFALSFLMILVGMLYFQAGLAKVFIGGSDWMLTGRTIYIFSHYFGTDLGHWLMTFPKVYWVFSTYTVIFELLFIFLIFSRKGLLIAFVLSALFHLGVGSIMTLSFWHLALLNIPLFLIPALPKKYLNEFS